MIKNKGYKFRLKPNKEQIIYLNKAFGCSRKMYNLYVDMLYSKLENQNFINGKIDYKSLELPTPAKIKKDYDYMKEIDSLAFANVQLNFKKAIKKYNKEHKGKTYKKKAKKQVKTLGIELTFKDLEGIPTFKSKKKNQKSFTTNNQNGTISIIYDKFVKIPKLYRKLENKLKLGQQRLSRKILKSNNWIKQKNKISKLQNKIASQRKDWLHKISYKLVNNYDVVVVEDINLNSMGQCLKLAKNLHDNGFGMFRNFLKYKLEDKGKQFIKIDK